MKTGLTTRGWNNVLIFASLFMIVLFNSTHQKFVSTDSESIKVSLIESSNIIQNIDFNGLKFERIGSSWRTVSNVQLSNNLTPQSFIQNWQHLQNEVLTSEPDISVSMVRFPVSVNVMGVTSNLVFEFIIDNEVGVVYILNHQKAQWMIIDQSQLPLFIPIASIN